jgi:hypothetical protein
MKSRILLAALALAALPGHATTIVTFVDPDRYTDVSNQRWEAQSTLDALEAHMKKLGDKYVGPNDTLRIDVLDIDLAGWARWGGRAPNEVRVVRGKADFPAMRIRYTLESGGRTQRSAEVSISDPMYTGHAIGRASNEPYYYEKRMLDDWFRSTFAQGAR